MRYTFLTDKLIPWLDNYKYLGAQFTVKKPVYVNITIHQH